MPRHLVAHIDDLPPGSGREIVVADRVVALFRIGDEFFAMDGICPHAGGPLGEGYVSGSRVTCPWHGYQYRPETGASPPPFNDKVATFKTKVVNGRVLLHPCAQPPGTYVEPSQIV